MRKPLPLEVTLPRLPVLYPSTVSPAIAYMQFSIFPASRKAATDDPNKALNRTRAPQAAVSTSAFATTSSTSRTTVHEHPGRGRRPAPPRDGLDGLLSGADGEPRR